MFLNPKNEKCKSNFIKFFPHLKLEINEDFDPNSLVGEYCHAYPVLEPINDPDKIRYELEQIQELKEINQGGSRKTQREKGSN
jgi:hypothetical protein